MSRIISAQAYTNNEVAFVAWEVDGVIPGCLGFEVTRIRSDKPAGDPERERVLPSWLPFEGQKNPGRKPQTTAVWPIQKLTWRDLTLRKKRDSTGLRESDFRVRYRIRPLVPRGSGTAPVLNLPRQTYQGEPVPLDYADEGRETNEALVSSGYGPITAVFTNGILAAQWLESALKSQGDPLSAPAVRKHISKQGDYIRRYLTGDVLGALKSLLVEAAASPGSEVRLALYELADQELVDLIIAHKSRVNVILSNSSKERGGDAWDAGNSKARAALKKAKVPLTNRMFNNGHIGHNKFAVLVGPDGQAQAVLTGSTNWTPTGLCGQSNNAVIVRDAEIARRYLGYWQALLEDTEAFTTPRPLSTGTSNAQGQALRTADAQPGSAVTLGDGTRVTPWFAPNTKRTTKGTETPPDLGAVYSLMRKAEHAILFACFLPSRSGKTSVIEEAIQIGRKDGSLLVYGTISDVTAMPNYVPAKKATADEEAQEGNKPSLFEEGGIRIVRAAALGEDDLVGEFEKELLKAGNAIIHDKVVVVDPLSNGGFVALGSHNLGYKASYENDENLLIIQGNKALTQAYAVHVLDLWEHYRFRAVREQMAAEKKDEWSGFLENDDAWLGRQLTSERLALVRYFAAPGD
ncbi:MAG TPA: phospholipase D-like domain-containing protein [Candidatus Methanoperedens sp.]|nr:phospholipase D-like domain-containing protein [Candidatus Methanoperedens sp.]